MLSAVIGPMDRAVTERDEHIPGPVGLSKVLEMFITTVIQTGGNNRYQLHMK